MRRIPLFALLKRGILAAAGLLAAVAVAGADTATLKVATSDIYGVSDTFSANGDEKVDGVQFETLRFTGGVTDMLAALRAGQIDIAEVGAAGPVVAQAAGTPFKVIAVTQARPKGEAIIVAQERQRCHRVPPGPATVRGRRRDAVDDGASTTYGAYNPSVGSWPFSGAHRSG
jgi:ABC-type taurine transport system substrate-binding protein